MAHDALKEGTDCMFLKLTRKEHLELLVLLYHNISLIAEMSVIKQESDGSRAI